MGSIEKLGGRLIFKKYAAEELDRDCFAEVVGLDLCALQNR
jgi:hypothetical protein